MSKPGEQRITYKIDDAEHKEIWIRAAYKHITAPHAMNIVAKESAFDLFKKYEIPEKKLAELTAKYYEAFPDKRPVEASDGPEEPEA